MATYYREDETEETITAKNGSFFENEELKELAGGSVDIIHMGEKGILVSRDDYYLIGVAKNKKATALALPYIPKHTYIAGPAFHLTLKDIATIPSWQKLEQHMLGSVQ